MPIKLSNGREALAVDLQVTAEGTVHGIVLARNDRGESVPAEYVTWIVWPDEYRAGYWQATSGHYFATQAEAQADYASRRGVRAIK